MKIIAEDSDIQFVQNNAPIHMLMRWPNSFSTCSICGWKSKDLSNPSKAKSALTKHLNSNHSVV